MGNVEIREYFDSVAQGCSDPERKARIELLREYWTNPVFRVQLADYIWEINNGWQRKKSKS